MARQKSLYAQQVEPIDKLAAVQRGAETGVPESILANFDVTSYRHASTILRHDFKAEYDELMGVLEDFEIKYSQIIVGGGGKGPIAVGFDDELKVFGWQEKQIPVEMKIDGHTYVSPGHKIDLFKNRIAVEMEWNNKTEFYDRDLDNFRKLHGLGAISLAIFVTRATELDETFKQIDEVVGGFNYRYYTKTTNEPKNVSSVSSKYGQSTTHADKLYPKIDGGGGGQCPILIFAIKPGPDVGIDDYTAAIELAKSKGKTYVEHEDLHAEGLEELADEEENPDESEV